MLAETILHDFGFETDKAENGKIAIKLLEKNEYDIILMDLMMPEMDGFEATQHIRTLMLPPKSNTPIIALTADITKVVIDKCSKIGISGYVSKPIDENLLLSKIMGLVKKTSNIKTKKERVVTENLTTKVTSLEYLKQRAKSNPELMMEMISLYLEQTPPLISAMTEGFLTKDWETIHKAVHKMIPSFSIVGISTEYETIAKKIQELAKQQQEDGIAELILTLEPVLIKACKELEEEYNTIKNRKG